MRFSFEFMILEKLKGHTHMYKFIQNVDQFSEDTQHSLYSSEQSNFHKNLTLFSRNKTKLLFRFQNPNFYGP